jgi:hypothetical protein
MPENDIVLLMRFGIFAVLMVIIFTVCPPLVSAPSTLAVLTGTALAITGWIAAGLSLTGGLDKAYKHAYRAIRDAFFT